MEACREFVEEQDIFVVRMNRRHGEAWNGNIVWIDGRCEQQFHNMQELIALMDSATQKKADR